MDPPCHRCKKTVYHVDKLLCLDKNWHKGCFNCEVCSITLSMKTYKGYNKLPYCNTHYPTTKFTAVADTPENLRMKKNTEQQSTSEYHKKFHLVKGKFTAIADDPETLRTKKSQKQASDLEYQNKIPKQEFSHTSERKKSLMEGVPQTEAPEHPISDQVSELLTESENVDDLEHAPEDAATPTAESVLDLGGQHYVALFKYKAADEEEVSFCEGDTIINAEKIGNGWMIGTIKRTGARGMLPSNYVEESLF